MVEQTLTYQFIPRETREERVVSFGIGNEHGYDTSFPIVITERTEPDGRILGGVYPAKGTQRFTVGQNILVTPMTKRYPSGGSLTIYDLAPLTTQEIKQ